MNLNIVKYIIETTGYFENPIILLNSKLVKDQAQKFIKNL